MKAVVAKVAEGTAAEAMAEVATAAAETGEVTAAVAMAVATVAPRSPRLRSTGRREDQ